MGRPIIQYPQDLVVVQEIIWEVEPDLIIETGVADDGSTVSLHSSLSLML
jgi:cephalosporin hydroxylase